MKYDFDEIQNRTGTNSTKWDFIYRDGIPMPRDAGPDPLGANELLPLWLADQDFQTARPIIDALVKRAEHGIFGYTRPTASYYEAIAGWMWRRHEWRVETDWILTTPGVVPAINLAIQTFTDPADKVIIQTPVFHPFAQSIENNGRVVVRNSLLYNDRRYDMDFDDLERKAANPDCKMIILCSPHNPVGRVWSAEELLRLGEICRQHDVLIVADEIHCDLTYSWSKFTTLGSVDDSLNERLILCNSPSKAFNLPGLKTSNTIIPDPMLRERFLVSLRNLNELFGYSVFGTLAIQTAYEQGEEWLTQLMEYLEANYVFVQNYLARHLPQLKLARPDALYLLWIDCRDLEPDPTALRKLFLDEAKVLLDEGSTYGVEGNGFVRINIACPRRFLEAALERIRRAVRES